MESRPVGKPSKKKHHLWLIVSFVFLGLLFFLIYTSFYNPSLGRTITGNVIGGSVGDNFIEIDATLLPPDSFEVDGKIVKIEIKTAKLGNFEIGRESIELDKASVVIDDFDGEIRFNKNNISRLSGTASKVFFEGIPISSESPMKVFYENGDYKYLKLNDFFLGHLEFDTSGLVKLNDGKVVVDLDDEEFRIENFQGDLEARKDSFKFYGSIEESNLGFIDVRAVGSKVGSEEGEEESGE